MDDGWKSAGSDSIDFLQAALDYAKRGWRVINVYPGEKRPVGDKWQERATTDPGTIRSWWDERPTCNIGVATGLESGFFVLDIDPKNGGDQNIIELQAEHGLLPQTYTVRTGSGGRHYYFTMPDFRLGNARGELKNKGIDIKGEGGQVLAPPSVTTLGGSYAVLLDSEIAAAPGWLLDMLKPQERRQSATAAVLDDDAEWPRQYALTVALPAAAAALRATDLNRNDALNSEAFSLGTIAAHGEELLDRDEAYDALRESCEANGLIAEDGMAAFRATFRSGWEAGLLVPREPWPPERRAVSTAVDVPVVSVSSRKLNELVDEMLLNIVRANVDEPSLFSHGSEIVKVVDQPARTAVVDANVLAYESETRMHFERTLPKGGVSVSQPPSRAIETIMSLPVKPFLHLNRLSYTPYFSPFGDYIDQPGYNTTAQTYYAPPPDLKVPRINEDPTADEVSSAFKFLQTELLHDFDFTSEADRANAVALMFLPFVRDVIDGPTPLHNIEAPTQGTGKGLLAKALLLPGVGGRFVTCGPARDNEEWEKRLVTFLRQTPQAIVIDNVNDKMDSGFLCTSLTEPEVTSRLLGGMHQVTIPIRSVWVMTANNPKFSGEVNRRTLRIRIDSKMEHPEDRGGFRHPDLLNWAAANRSDLVAACCTVVQGWVRAGMPEFVGPYMGSFERWHAVLGGLTNFVGLSGLAGNKEEFRAASDDEANAWDQLVDLLRVKGYAAGVDRWSSLKIAEIVTDAGLSIDLGRSEQSKALMMGRQLSRQRDRWHAGYKFEKTVSMGQTLWRLVGGP